MYVSFLTLSAEFLQLKNDLEKRLDDVLKRDKDLVIEEGYAGTTVISVSLARANDTDMVSGNISEYRLRRSKNCYLKYVTYVVCSM